MADPNTPAVKPTGEQAIIDTVKELHGTQHFVRTTQGGDEINLAMVPKGIDVHDIQTILDKYRKEPRVRAAAPIALTLESFIQYGLDFACPDTLCFFDNNPIAPKVLAVLDHHKAGAYNEVPASFCRHTLLHVFKLDDDWVAWNKISGRWLELEEFADFVEDHLAEVTTAPENPAGDKAFQDIMRGMPGARFGTSLDLMSVAKGLRINEMHKVTQALNTDTGEISIAFESEQQGVDGQKLKFPNAYLLLLRVFDREEDPWRIAARFRFKKNGTSVSYKIELYRPDNTFKAAIDDAKKTIETAGLKTVYGWPNASLR